MLWTRCKPFALSAKKKLRCRKCRDTASTKPATRNQTRSRFACTRESSPAMKFVDEFREPELVTRTAEEIRRLADPKRHYRLMEVCGGHTHAIYRFGLKDLLPENIELIHGPGCPVCVLPMGRIDDGLSLAE